MRVSVSRNSDFEGAETISIEIPSFSFTAFQNPTKTSEMVYSLNPFIWFISTLSNSGSMRNTGGGVPLFNAILEGLPNLKIDIVLYKSLSLNLGVDLDYLLAKESIGMRGGAAAGLKYQISQASLKLLYNWESIEFISFYDRYHDNGFRLDVSYDLGNTSFAKYIYHCGITD